MKQGCLAKLQILMLAVGITPVTSAQVYPDHPAEPVTLADTTPKFEAASIKAVRGSWLDSSERVDNSQAEWMSIPLLALIMRAYGVLQSQISAPDWTFQRLFEIRAKLPEGAQKDQVPAMLRSLLAERFRLVVHIEHPMKPSYDLVVGKDKLGMRISAATDVVAGHCAPSESPNRILCRGMSMGDITNELSSEAQLMAKMPVRNTPAFTGLNDRPVVDMTGLARRYDFELTRQPGSGVDWVNAIKGFGLKLVPSVRPIPLVVVDHIEQTPIPD